MVPTNTIQRGLANEKGSRWRAGHAAHANLGYVVLSQLHNDELDTLNSLPWLYSVMEGSPVRRVKIWRPSVDMMSLQVDLSLRLALQRVLCKSAA